MKKFLLAIAMAGICGMLWSCGDDEPEAQGADFSAATVESCDSRVDAKIVNCRRSGNTVQFSFRLTNMGLGEVNDFRVFPPKSMSQPVGATLTSVWTDDGYSYLYPTIVFGGKKSEGGIPVTIVFSEDVPYNGTITISDVDAAAKTLNVNLGVYAYPPSKYNMASTVVKFHNVPIR